jgi:DNA-directed RNA polymerase subunit RPC12/RpoP
MSATEELRRLLDERGVEWWPDTYYKDTNTCWRIDSFEWRASERDGKLLVGGTCTKYLTPEDAIAATAGDDTPVFICKKCGVAYELDYIDKEFGKPNYCPHCGYRRLYV